jgi:hypothetical protein
MLHGHIHQNLIDDPQCVNMCVEHCNYTPVPLEEVADGTYHPLLKAKTGKIAWKTTMLQQSYSVVKKNRRISIEKDGEIVYTPPEFLRPLITSREVLQDLANEFNKEDNVSISANYTF